MQFLIDKHTNKSDQRQKDSLICIFIYLTYFPNGEILIIVYHIHKIKTSYPISSIVRNK